MSVRDAIDEDLPVVLEIYNDWGATTMAIWNEERVDLANRRSWLGSQRVKGFPVLVARTEAGNAVGYASYGEWRQWDGYRHTAELTVHVHRDVRGSGVGSHLLAALIERARTQGKHILVAGIDSGNVQSLRLHARHGFTEVGRMPEVGAKAGQWLDLVFMQLKLDERSAP